ncbi:hypothetical protein GCM10025857_08870 [Alicyclobacillus contaminans]|uniref:hypothetical protein n=1 Tax=Alicyclobacillus contaminans TaxID=392016 RepID=UPI000421CD88|nr:hypothetical protein [Alicyclobacillus contaminans]GMA49530.1 hypothetical protein GCM10025857_08870 [Alicyclobacillus contaminans]
MTAIHGVVGIVTLIVSVALLLWNAFRLGRRLQTPSYRMVLVGLLDLQVLLGIITWIIHPRGGAWLLHPLFALVAAAVAHTMLKERRKGQIQMIGYVLVFALLVVTVLLSGRHG